MITLRPYQERVIRECINALNSGENALVQAPTGAGKSIILASIIKELAPNVPGFRCCVLIDREILVRQLARTFHEVTGYEVGIACKTVKNKVQLNKAITVASRQTLATRLEGIKPFHLIICDEAHLLPLRRREEDNTDQYSIIINHLQRINKNSRLLGCTATPWRLDSGFIYGEKVRRDLDPWWNHLTSRIMFNELTMSGHLCRLRGQIADYDKIDLSNVKMNGYEFNLGDLGRTMCKYVHVVKQAIDEHLDGKNHILVFACTIQHCEELKTVIPDSETLHSKSDDPQDILRRFEANEFRILISVNKLSIGFDLPAASSAIMARPTMSSSLYLQMLGRVLRPYSGKDEAFLIDLTDNTAKHCPALDLDNVFVRIPPVPGDGIAPIKFCEAQLSDGRYCYAENHTSAIYCIVCGAEFPKSTIPAEYMPNLTGVVFEQEEPQWFEVNQMRIEEHVSKKNEKRLIRVTLGTGGFNSKNINVWICTPDEYGNGFATRKGRQTWDKFCDEVMPDKIDTALWIAQEKFKQPDRVLCQKTADGYYNFIDAETVIPF